MTTLIVPVTTGWTNVTLECSLVAEQVYSIKNVGENPVTFYRGATAPHPTSTGHIIKPKYTWRPCKQELNIFLYFKVLGGSSLLSTLAVSRIIAGDSSGGGEGTPEGDIGENSVICYNSTPEGDIGENSAICYRRDTLPYLTSGYFDLGTPLV
jgi:hypothetical protein